VVLLVIAVTIHIHTVTVVTVAVAAHLVQSIAQLMAQAAAAVLVLLHKELTVQAAQTEFQVAADQAVKTAATENHIATVLAMVTAKAVAMAVVVVAAAHHTEAVGAAQERLELFGVQAEATLMLQVNLI